MSQQRQTGGPRPPLQRDRFKETIMLVLSLLPLVASFFSKNIVLILIELVIFVFSYWFWEAGVLLALGIVGIVLYSQYAFIGWILVLVAIGVFVIIRRR